MRLPLLSFSQFSLRLVFVSCTALCGAAWSGQSQQNTCILGDAADRHAVRGLVCELVPLCRRCAAGAGGLSRARFVVLCPGPWPVLPHLNGRGVLMEAELRGSLIMLAWEGKLIGGVAVQLCVVNIPFNRIIVCL